MQCTRDIPAMFPGGDFSPRIFSVPPRVHPSDTSFASRDDRHRRLCSVSWTSECGRDGRGGPQSEERDASSSTRYSRASTHARVHTTELGHERDTGHGLYRLLKLLQPCPACHFGPKALPRWSSLLVTLWCIIHVRCPNMVDGLG